MAKTFGGGSAKSCKPHLKDIKIVLFFHLIFSSIDDLLFLQNTSSFAFYTCCEDIKRYYDGLLFCPKIFCENGINEYLKVLEENRGDISESKIGGIGFARILNNCP